MAVELISDLRKHFPGHFDNRDDRISAEDYLIIPTLDDDFSSTRELEEVLAEWPIENTDSDLPESDLLEPLSDEQRDGFTGHPGGLLEDPDRRSGDGSTTAIDVLAFYLPFHRFDQWWGIYMFPSGILRIRTELQPLFRRLGTPPREQVRMAKNLLYHHEYYHHAVESFGTRLEAITGRAFYLEGISARYMATQLTGKCFEEACANSYAREKILDRFGNSSTRAEIRKALNDWFANQPPGYSTAATTSQSWMDKLRIEMFEDYLNTYPGMGAVRSGYSIKALRAAWLTAGGFDRGVADIRSRISYIIPKSSPFYNRLPADVRTCIKTDKLKKTLRKKKLGRFKRQGGNHEIWESWDGKHKTQIARHKGRDIPKGTLRSILNGLNISMSPEEFLQA